MSTACCDLNTLHIIGTFIDCLKKTSAQSVKGIVLTGCHYASLVLASINNYLGSSLSNSTAGYTITWIIGLPWVDINLVIKGVMQV